MSVQLPLSLRLRDDATLENFLPGANGALVAAVRASAAGTGDRFLCFWGPPGSGRTHLLQAACHLAGGLELPAAYLPLGETLLAPEVLEGLESLALVCLDDLDRVAGAAEWETALFHFYNRAREAGTVLLVAAGKPPGGLGIRLADLRSRLAWGPVYQLRPLDDGGKLALLRLRAQARGLQLEDGVAAYLLRRCARDPRDLMELLETLDRASLVNQRRLTIPFVKSVLGL